LALVDTKEANNHDLWFDDSRLAQSLPGTFAHEQINYQIKALDFGDIWVSLDSFRWLIIELKTWEDLHGSVRDTGAGRVDSRIRHQVEGLIAKRELGFEIAVMIVGIATLAGGRSNAKGVYLQNKGRRVNKPWNYFELEQIRATLQRLGILVYQAPSEAQVPHAVRLIAELYDRKEVFPQPGLPRLTNVSPRHDFLVSVLTGVPGVGVATAQIIAHEFKTFARFYHEATVERLAQLPDIGKITAERIYAAWHGLESGFVLTPEMMKEWDPYA